MAEQVTKIINDLKNAKEPDKQIEYIKTLSEVATNEELKYHIAKEGITKIAIDLLKSKNENVQKYSAYLLHCLSFGSDKARSLIGAEGAIPPLVSLLTSQHKTVRNQIALTLGSLVKGSNKNKVAVTKAGGVEPLAEIILNSNEAKLIENVTAVIRNLATNGGIAVDIIKANCCPKLISFLTGSASLQSESIHALSNLSSHDGCREPLIDAKVLDEVVPLLNSANLDTASAAAEMIMFLAQDDKCIPKMEAALEPMINVWKKSDKMPKLKNYATETLKSLGRVEKFKYTITSKEAGKALIAASTGSPKSAHSAKIAKLTKIMYDPDQEKATEAAKQLAELAQREGQETKEEILRSGVFAHLWKSAKQGKLGWADKWYNTIEQSKLSFKEELGSGAFAIVYKGTLKNKGKKEDVAIKAMDESLINLPDLRCELATLSMLSGIVQNMVEFKGYFFLQQKSKGKIKTSKNYHCIVMELMETHLEEILHGGKDKKPESLSDQGMKFIALDIAIGMSKLHSFDILHRDLKPANILLSKCTDNSGRQYIVRIADFGYARRDTLESVRKSVVGTPAYLAPELIGQTKSFDVSKPTDVYSYGVVIWEMVTRKRPYEGMEVTSLYQTVFDAKKTNKPILPVPDNCDPVLKALMERCLLPDPSKRPTFEDIQNMLTAATSNSSNSNS